MTISFTKPAADIFNPVDGSGNARGPVMGEVQTWGSEVEGFLNLSRIAFSAHKNSTDQSGIASDTATKVTFGTESFDVGGYYDASTSRFSPPAGIYLVGTRVTYISGVVDQSLLFAMIYKNGIEVHNELNGASGTSTNSARAIGLIQINEGDYLEVYARAQGAGTKTVYGSQLYTNFWASKVDGVPGDTGSTGPAGGTGPNVGLDYAFNTATSGDPGSGKVLVNNATPASITQINISETNRQSISQAAFLALQDDSTASSKCIVRILDVAAPGSNFIDLAITGALTDAGTYDTFPVSYVGSGGTIANNAIVSVVFFRTGNNGANGADGSNGSNGTNGTNGTNGVSAPAVNFTFSTTITDSDPGNGTLRYNNATVASVTSLYVDNLESGGGTVTGWLDAMDDSTNTKKGVLYINKASDPTKFAIFYVTGSVVDGTGYRKISVTYLAASGTFTNADAIQVLFSSAGDTAAAASTTAAGISELATDAEMQTGTDSARVPSVQAVRNGTGAGWSSFLAKKSTDQTSVADTTFTQITFDTEVYDVGSNFASNAWTPPAGKVNISLGCIVTGTIASGNTCYIVVYKDGVIFRNAICPATTNVAGGVLSFDDIATGSNVYTAYVYIDVTSGTATISGATQNTFFSGHMIN